GANVLARIKSSVRMAVAATLQLMVNQAMSQPTCDIVKLAEEYIAKQYPSFDPTGMKPVVSETMALWEVTYELPQDMLGGAPIISIDKRTCTIVRAQITQ